MSGTGPLSGLLDKPMTARQIIRAAKSVPALARESVADVKGAGVKRGRGRPKKSMAGCGSVVGEFPEPASVVGDVDGGMVGTGAKGRPAKGSQEMRDRMAKLRALKKK